MSGIYIPGMKMPKKEGQIYLIRIYSDGKVIGYYGNVIGQAIELPPHGRLIDADKLCKSVKAQTEIVRKWGIDELTEIADLLEKGFLQEVENAETVIPADPEREA